MKVVKIELLMKPLRSTFSHELDFKIFKKKNKFLFVTSAKNHCTKKCVKKRHLAAAGSKKFSKNPDKNQLWADSMTRFGT